MARETPDPLFFASPAELRRWLERHHEGADSLWVGFHKVRTGKPSLTWPQSVDEALCFGWIDGLRKSWSEDAYVIRFTKRRPNSIWSNVNVRRMEELTALGLVRPAGLAAFAERDPKRTGVYSAENNATLDAAGERRFRAKKKAWKFFEAQAPSYRRTAMHWVVTAKREETRERRLAELIATSGRGERLRQFTSPVRPRPASGRAKKAR